MAISSPADRATASSGSTYSRFLLNTKFRFICSSAGYCAQVEGMWAREHDKSDDATGSTTGQARWHSTSLWAIQARQGNPTFSRTAVSRLSVVAPLSRVNVVLFVPVSSLLLAKNRTFTSISSGTGDECVPSRVRAQLQGPPEILLQDTL